MLLSAARRCSSCLSCFFLFFFSFFFLFFSVLFSFFSFSFLIYFGFSFFLPHVDSPCPTRLHTCHKPSRLLGHLPRIQVKFIRGSLPPPPSRAWVAMRARGTTACALYTCVCQAMIYIHKGGGWIDLLHGRLFISIYGLFAMPACLLVPACACLCLIAGVNRGSFGVFSGAWCKFAARNSQRGYAGFQGTL